MDTKRSFFSRHLYGRPWAFIQQTLNDTIFCMPRTCAPAVVGSAWALSMSSSKSVCACAESRACSAAYWTLPQTKSEWNKWNSLSIPSLRLTLTELRNSDIVVEILTTLVCDLFAANAPVRPTASVRATYALTDKLHTSC